MPANWPRRRGAQEIRKSRQMRQLDASAGTGQNLDEVHFERRRLPVRVSLPSVLDDLGIWGRAPFSLEVLTHSTARPHHHGVAAHAGPTSCTRVTQRLEDCLPSGSTSTNLSDRLPGYSSSDDRGSSEKRPCRVRHVGSGSPPPAGETQASSI